MSAILEGFECKQVKILQVQVKVFKLFASAVRSTILITVVGSSIYHRLTSATIIAEFKQSVRSNRPRADGNPCDGLYGSGSKPLIAGVVTELQTVFLKNQQYWGINAANLKWGNFAINELELYHCGSHLEHKKLRF
ncbi:hypothetical protein M3201_20515 [Paenibacillus motobuensis]|uniref:hypothetical protein n=1 Tax=Paenibacillus TaxID=44249 RepID=UPI00203CC188|nr:MULTISPECIES: hypothetical protein [Paenibacillus]MCM3042065.1 hypothetical protein [Paenibacillus lutimineralis]MCM3649169.1 hypothetical protein [Paenibacillus motobuensis]